MAHFPDQTKVFHRYANTPPERHFTTASKNKKNRGPGVSPKAAPFKVSGSRPTDSQALPS
jgi:hypothetical protein